MRERKIVKYGNGYFISLYKMDIEDFGLIEGDKLDLDELFKDFLKQSKNKRGNYSRAKSNEA